MPYRVEYRPSKSRPKEPWAKVEKSTGKIASRHRSKKRAEASIRAYYASRVLTTHARHTLTNHVRSPLRLDPTRSILLRRSFMRAITKRLRSFQRELRDFILEKDALGLGDRPSFIQMAENVFRRQYEFLSNPAKLEAFRAWFQRQVDAGILAPLPGAPPGRPWTAEYVESAYKRGQMNAFLASKREGLLGPSIFGMTPEQFLISSFMAPEAMSKVLLLGTRAWNEMKGLTDAMGQQLNRILAQGIADGIGVERIAKQMTDVISGLARSRALTIARSEIIRAHAEGQLDAYDKLGVAELGVQAEWSTAHDERVCPRCAPNEGKTFTIAEARGLIPLHPNCRCSWIPSVPKNLTKT